jgi:hypothetical protein
MTLAILTEVLYGFPQSVQKNGGVEPQLDHNNFLPQLFQFIIHPPFYHLTLHSLVAGSIIK